jgi:hypothetical protein
MPVPRGSPPCQPREERSGEEGGERGRGQSAWRRQRSEAGIGEGKRGREGWRRGGEDRSCSLEICLPRALFFPPMQYTSRLSSHLQHEVFDAAVEGGSVVVAHIAQREEVLARAGCHVTVQLHVEVPWGVEGCGGV